MRALLLLLLVLWPSNTHADDSCLDVVVRVRWDEQVAETVQGVIAKLEVPKGLYLPTAKDGSVLAQVERISSRSGGLFDVVPHDSDDDGQIDLLNIGLLNQKIPAGPFVRLSFSCREGARASTDRFECGSDVSASFGAIESTCSVEADESRDGERDPTRDAPTLRVAPPTDERPTRR